MSTWASSSVVIHCRMQSTQYRLPEAQVHAVGTKSMEPLQVSPQQTQTNDGCSSDASATCKDEIETSSSSTRKEEASVESMSDFKRSCLASMSLS